MGYRHHKSKQDMDAHRQKGYNQITEIAKKSPRAGLAQMGTALKKYYAKNQAYPSKLVDLYPTYVANKSFIEEIDWYYEPRGDDFFLSKTVIVGNKRMVASIDKGLRPQAETGIMVATPTPVPKTLVAKAKEVEKLEELALEGSEESAQERLAMARERFLKTLRQRQIDVTSVSLPERDEAKIISTVQPEIISISEPEIGSDVEFELSYKYLVWKDNNGVLGFSNIRYPDTDQLSICAVGRWYNVKIPLPKGQEPIDTKTETAREKKDPEMTATSLDRYCLVWKDQHGTLGFGNVQYPERDPVSVFQTDSWISIQRPHLAIETGSDEGHGLRKGKSHQRIASELSTKYLVWKDQHGTLGFGNVQYPERDPVSVFQTDSWVSMERPYLVTEAGPDEDHGLQKGKSHQTIASELSTRYLVWKDKHGTLGFGNVQYPEMRHTSYIHLNGSWEPVAN